MSSRISAWIPLALRKAILHAVDPARDGDEGVLRALAEEARESNGQTVRWIVTLLCPIHAVVVVVLLSFHETDSQRAAWLFGLIAINAALCAAGAVGSIVAFRRRPAWLYAVLGDLGGALYLLGGAAMTANAQRAHPNLNIFLIVVLFNAIRLRMRPAVYLSALLAGATLVLFGMARFRVDAVTRTADYLTLLSLSSISALTFLLTRGMRVRELQARRQVDHLNAQLNEKIRERSRELTLALTCLAEGHRELLPGTVLGGRVELEAPIGWGGMGVVYRGRDLLTSQVVAVKVVQAGSASELDGLYRFLREAQIVASVTHKAIVRPIHVDVSDDGRLFQMMELVEGETLDSCLSRLGVLPPLTVARLGSVLADALASAHQARVVHLDVKPANVMLTRAKPGLKLLDFGISQLRGARGAHVDRESSDTILGTPEFLSPEHLKAPAWVDERADVYALGLVLYLAIAGRMPFDVASPPEWLFAHALHTPRALSQTLPAIDPALAEIVMSCLSKDPNRRPTARDVASVLAEIADAEEVPPLEALDLVVLNAPSSRIVGAVASGASRESSSTTQRSTLTSDPAPAPGPRPPWGNA